MLRVIVLLLAFISLQGQVSGVYVRIQALNANGGRTGGGERVVAFSNNRASMSQYHSSGEGRSQQEWEMVEVPRNKTVHLYLRGDPNTRLTMHDTDGNFFDVGLDSTNRDDPKQQFMFQHQKVYCNAGQHYYDGRLYSLQYQGNGDTGSAVVCGPSHDTDEEEMNMVSTEDVQIDGNEFFIVNKVYPHAKLAQLGTGYWDRGTSEGPYSPDKMWTLEKGPGSHNHYYIKNVKYQGYRLAQYGTDYGDFSVYNGPHYNDQLWRFEKVIDNLGDQWDYYRIWNKERRNYRLAKYGTGDKDVSVFSGSLYDDQLWRLVARYEVQDEGYIPIRRHTGQPTDITEVVTYTKGLKLTRGTTISTKVGFSTTVKLAVEKGPFSASVASTISAELSVINTASVESSWSVQRTTTRVFPANQDCTLYQRRVKYLSDIHTDQLTQTPADFKMICKPLTKVTRLLRLLDAIVKE